MHASRGHANGYRSNDGANEMIPADVPTFGSCGSDHLVMFAMRASEAEAAAAAHLTVAAMPTVVAAAAVNGFLWSMTTMLVSQMAVSSISIYCCRYLIRLCRFHFE